MIRTSVSTPVLALFLCLFLAMPMIFSPGARAESHPKNFDLPLQSNTETSPEALTTDKIAELDPAQPNAHLRRWVVSRKIEIANWKGRKLPGGLYGVSGGGITGTSTIYLRPAGPWYDTLAQFPCHESAPEPANAPVFATEAGSRREAQAAAKLWDEMLSAGKFKLSLLLSRVAAVNEKSASSKADRVFQEWLQRLDHEWRARIASEVIPKQWKAERKEAEQAGFCLAGKKAKPSEKPTSPEVWIAQELQTAIPPKDNAPAARAPSRRWDGFFVIRMDVGVSDNSILGQMLIDPLTPRSVLSPDWMRSQGMPPEWLLVPEAQPEHVRILEPPGPSLSPGTTQQTGLGKVLRVDHAVVSGLPLPLTRFLLFNTDLFDEPEFAAPCCSGVLGIDLFRRYVLEFRAGKPTEVNLWKVSGFTAPKDDQWVELRENAKGEMVAICSDRVKALPHSEKLCQDPRRALREATGEMIFDLPHGLLWYSPEELAAPEYKNTSGLKLNYTYLKGDRVLVVQSIGRGTVAEQLEKAGLKKGMVITDIDDIPALDLDLWEVNRRLSGVYGDKVTLKWKTSKGVVTEPLQLLRREIRGQ